MSELLVLIKKELLEQWRTKKVLILIIVFLFVAIASPIFAKLTPELLKGLSVQGMKIELPTPTYHDAIDQLIKNISQIALLVIVFIVAGSVTDEKNKKTLEIILTKPISRTKFILSKFFSNYICLGLIFISSMISFYLYTMSIFTDFNIINFIIVTLIVLMYVLMIVSITILASTIFRNSIAAGAIGFISFILFGTIFSMIDQIKAFSPNLIFSNYKDIIANGYIQDLTKPLIVISIMIIASIITSIVLFKHQEIER